MIVRRVAAGVGANIFDKLAISLSQIVMVPVFAASWGLHLYGLWALLTTIPSFLAMGDLGFATAAGVKMTMANAGGDRAQATRTFQSAWSAILLCSLLLTGIAAALALWLPLGLFGSDPGLSAAALRATLLFLMLYGIIVLQQSIFFAGLRCDGHFASGAAAHGCIVVVESAAAIAVVLAGGTPPGAAAAMCAGRLAGVIGLTVLLRRKVPWLPMGFAAAERGEVRSLLAPAGSVMLLPLANALYLQGSAIALGAAAGQAAVPAFTATRTLSRLGLQLCLMVNTAMMPEFSAATARGDRRGQAAMVLVTLAVSALIILPVAAVLAVAGKPLVAMWTRGVIVPPTALLLAMAGSTLAIGLWYPLSNLLLAMSRHSGYTLVFALLSAAGFPLTYVLSMQLGSPGAGLTMCVIDAIMLASVVGFVRRRIVPIHELRAVVPSMGAEFGRIARRFRPGGRRA